MCDGPCTHTSTPPQPGGGATTLRVPGQLPLLPAHHTHYTSAVCGRAQASREPLPGGYALGEQIYFTGSSKRFEDGDRLEHGKQGEVVGPAVGESCG